MNLRKKGGIVLALLMVAGTAFYFYQQSEKKKPHYRPIPEQKKFTRKVDSTGEVVDAWCYASQTMGPGRGPGHKACALACVYGGVSVGIVEDGSGDLYVAAKYKGYKGCKELLIPYMGERVHVTGVVGEMGGCRMLRIQTVELAKPLAEEGLKNQKQE